MPFKWKKTAPIPPPTIAPSPPASRGASAVLLDFVFGDPLPQPDVVEHDSEQAWQDWLDAKARQDGGKEFEDTRPMGADTLRHRKSFN